MYVGWSTHPGTTNYTGTFIMPGHYGSQFTSTDDATVYSSYYNSQSNNYLSFSGTDYYYWN